MQEYTWSSEAPSQEDLFMEGWLSVQ